MFVQYKRTARAAADQAARVIRAVSLVVSLPLTLLLLRDGVKEERAPPVPPRGRAPPTTPLTPARRSDAPAAQSLSAAEVREPPVLETGSRRC